MFNNKKLLALSILIVVIALGSASFAAALELTWPSSPGGTALTDASTLTDLVKYFYEWGIALGGLAAFVSLVIAGFSYLTSVGDPGKINDAKDRATSAFLGLILLLGSWLILNTINPELTQLTTPNFTGPVPVAGTCNADSDCPQPVPATSTPFIVKYTCEKSPGSDIGMCIAKKMGVTCSKVVVYDQVNWPTGATKETIILDPENPKKQETEVFKAQSVKALYVDSYGVEKECGETACGCSIQLFAGGWFFGWGCGDMIGQVPAWDQNLNTHVDREIQCVRAIAAQKLSI